MDRLELGHFGQQPQGEVLCDHRGGAAPTGEGCSLLAAADERDGSRDGDGERCGRGTGMSELQRLMRRVRSFFRKHALDGDLDAELAAHLEMAIEDHIARGLPPHEARRAALASMGGLPQPRKKLREARGLMTLDMLGQDIRYTLRT